jgi:hypothetical protein
MQQFYLTLLSAFTALHNHSVTFYHVLGFGAAGGCLLIRKLDKAAQEEGDKKCIPQQEG